MNNARPAGRSPLLLAAIAVCVVGVVLAVVGLIAGGTDQSKRDSLQAEVSSAQKSVKAAEKKLDAAMTQASDFVEGAQDIIHRGDEFCGCGRRGKLRQEELATAMGNVIANETQASVDAYNKSVEEANAEKERMEKALTQLRALQVGLPEVSGS